MQFGFCSALPADYRDDLEALLFFNPQQEAAGAGVAQAIEAFGAPRIAEVADMLSVTVPHHDVQPLFALAESADGCQLAGVIVYVRTDASNITVLHVAVSERFSSAGADRAALLVMRLLREVTRCARRIGGVRQINLLYCNRHLVLRLDGAASSSVPPAEVRPAPDHLICTGTPA